MSYRQRPHSPSGNLTAHYGCPARFRTRMRGYRIVGATLSSLILLILWFSAVNTRKGQIVDTLTMDAAAAHLRMRIVSSHALAALVSYPVLIGVGMFVLLVTLVRGRMGLSVRAVLVFAAANIATQLTKECLQRPDLGVGQKLENSFPSGHVTLVASVVVTLIAVVPIAYRSLVAYLGAGVTTFVGMAVMNLGWHRLSDVLSAIAMVAVFSLLALPSEWIPTRRKLWTGLLAWVSSLSTLFCVVSMGVLTLSLPFGSGSVPSAALTTFASNSNQGTWVTVVSVVFMFAASGLMVTGVDRLAGHAPR